MLTFVYTAGKGGEYPAKKRNGCEKRCAELRNGQKPGMMRNNTEGFLDIDLSDLQNYTVTLQCSFFQKK